MSIPILRIDVAGAALLLMLAMHTGGTKAENPGSDSLAEASPPELVEHPLNEAIAYLRQRQARLKDINDYAAVFRKTERIDDVVIEQTMEMKCRHKPFSVYLRNRSGKEKGREALYVAGANDGRLLVRDRTLLGRLAGTQKLKLDDPLVSAENRHPITEIGIAKLLENAISRLEAECRNDADNFDMRVSITKDDEGRSSECLEISRRRATSRSPYMISRIYFELDSQLPSRAEEYGWPENAGENPPILERYRYEDVRVNLGLTDDDFDAHNEVYGFVRRPPK